MDQSKSTTIVTGFVLLVKSLSIRNVLMSAAFVRVEWTMVIVSPLDVILVSMLGLMRSGAVALAFLISLLTSRHVLLGKSRSRAIAFYLAVLVQSWSWIVVTDLFVLCHVWGR
jgi:hypothetical protein